MRTGKLDDKDYTIVIVQNVEEARVVGSDQIISLVHCVRISCEECGREAYCSPDSIEIARPNPYPVCIGCLGDAARRFSNLDADGVRNFVNLAETYKRELARLRRGVTT